MKRWTMRLLALLLMAMLTPGAARAEDFLDWLFEATATPAPTPAPDASPAPEATIPDCAFEDDGWVRVYLRSLDMPSQLHLTLAGKYAIEGDRGFRFDRGTVVTLYLEDGEIWLNAGGVTIDMGLAVTLTRHASMEPQNGLYIRESEKPNLYCGDLSVYAMEKGLRPVLKIQLEDYLMGVVAYEMSDSFPLEALKAQAVAARTYAIKRKWRAGRRDYDVVDTTADQVFKGLDPELKNVAEAVSGTRGLVGIYDGSFATCYYTASNGGQTALSSQIWGAEGEDYLAMTDDSYDLENPKSLVNYVSITAQGVGSQALTDRLNAALGEVMAAEGFAPDAWALDAIANIEPIDPRYEGSRMFDHVAFDLRVRVAEGALATPTPEPTASPDPSASAEPAPTPAAQMSLAPEVEPWVVLPETRRVVLDTYEDIKRGLNLGLNDADYELFSVETQRDEEGEAVAFRLAMRRYGHGVGMSQRGAQWMAGNYGMGFMDILRFYYPGMSVERMNWTDTALMSLMESEEARGAARPKPTPTPAPEALPTLRPGERYARVAATTLNVRQQPSTTSRILDMLDQDTRLITSGEADENGWIAVRTGSAEGFVKAEYLSDEG